MSKEQKINCRKCVTDWNKDQCSCNCHKETKLPECNCQYEEGHSFECPLYRPTPNPLEELKEWEEKLKEIFNKSKTDRGIIRTLNNFISQQIDKAYKEGEKSALDTYVQYAEGLKEVGKQETIAKVREMIEGMKKNPERYKRPIIDKIMEIKKINPNDPKRKILNLTISKNERRDNSYNKALQDLSDKLKGI